MIRRGRLADPRFEYQCLQQRHRQLPPQNRTKVDSPETFGTRLRWNPADNLPAIPDPCTGWPLLVQPLLNRLESVEEVKLRDVALLVTLRDIRQKFSERLACPQCLRNPAPVPVAQQAVEHQAPETAEARPLQEVQTPLELRDEGIASHRMLEGERAQDAARR